MKRFVVFVAWVFAAVALACGRSGDHEHAHGEEESGHGHGHAEDAVGITRWTDEVELFAEHPPAVVGQKMSFLAHVTVLDQFEALNEGEVTLVLEGAETLRGVAREPLRPGIFQPEVTPRRPGTYRGRLEVRSRRVEDVVGGFTIEVHPSAEAAQRAAAGEDEAEGTTISFLKEQQWQVPFDTAFARREMLAPTIEVAGEVTTPPDGSAEIGASIAGRVVAPPEGLPRPGVTVRRGQLLATIAPAPSSPEEGARAELAIAEADARAAAARSELARAERLAADRAISDREVEQARREVQVADEAVRAARRAQSLFRGSGGGGGAGSWRLTAPIEGVLTEVNATPGAPVSPDTVLFRIVDPTELWIRARVPEQDAARVVAGADASYRVSGLETWSPIDVTGEDANASLVSIGRTVHPQSRTVDVIYALRSADPALRVGALVRVALPSGTARESVVVPRDAVLDSEGRTVVYVQVEGEAFEERTVRAGDRAGSRVAILHGVEAGERVVTRGASFVRLAARGPAEAGHGHVH